MATIKDKSSTGTKTSSGSVKAKKEKLINIAMVSANTGNLISFQYLADKFCQSVFKCKADKVTFEQAQAVIPDLMSNERVTCVVTDMTIDKFEGITLENY